MKQYNVIIGVYVRTYASFSVQAKTDKAAKKAALEKFRDDSSDIAWQDTDYSSQAMPSIVVLQDEKSGQEVIRGEDFALNTDDSRDFMAAEMLAFVDQIAGLSFKHENSAHFADDCIDTLRSLAARAKGIAKKAHAGEKYKA